MRSLVPAFLVSTTLAAAAAAAACGGGETGPGAQVPTASAPAPTETAPAGSAPPTASATAPGSAAPTATATGTAAAPPVVGPMTAIKPSAMADELKALGLDPKKLPPLDKMEPEKLRKVMKTIAKAVGTQCTGCHDANDFKAWTPNKRVASHMWNDWVRGLVPADGSVLYCDSCHQGHVKFLDRSNKKALGKWMQDNFVDKLKRVDKKDHGCETCHGDPFDGDFLAKWEAEAKAKAKANN
jgi:hypothetical protein